jgi:CRP/FNR family transcriptional regulator, dissimilatory nitrate respiration regulator
MNERNAPYIDRTVASLASLGRTRSETVAARAHLFRQGDPVTSIFLVESGCVRLERCTATGATVVLHTASAGEMLAEAALFSDVYHCNAVALKAARVRIYDKHTLLAALKPGSPAYALLAMVAHQLMQARQRLEWRNVRSAQERVMLYLGLKTDRNGEFKAKVALQDIAAELGLTREAFYRALAALERDRRIKRKEDSILIVKRAR